MNRRLEQGASAEVDILAYIHHLFFSHKQAQSNDNTLHTSGLQHVVTHKRNAGCPSDPTLPLPHRTDASRRKLSPKDASETMEIPLRPTNGRNCAPTHVADNPFDAPYKFSLTEENDLETVATTIAHIVCTSLLFSSFPYPPLRTSALYDTMALRIMYRSSQKYSQYSITIWSSTPCIQQKLYNSYNDEQETF